MRLLAPAVLLSLVVFIGSQSGHAASFLLHSPPGQTATTQNTAQSLAGSAISSLGSGNQEPGQQAGEAHAPATINVPAGTRITLLLVDPVWAKTVKAGDAVYAMTAFPVVSSGTMAIPPGTYVLGAIDAVTKPSWKDARALFQMHFSKIIFANGYTLALESAPLQAASATVHVQVTSHNDVLLDNGTQFDMILQAPLSLDPNSVAQAVRRSQPLKFGATKSASMCRPIPATPGTSDTVIPGTPGTPGTPDITIPGPNGTTTTIPGSPGTPGTSPTIIPGTPGTPEIPCPAPPAVISGPVGPQIHRQSFQVTNELLVAGKKLAPGSYDVVWLGTGTAVQVEVQQRGKTIVLAPARISLLPQSSTADKTVTRTDPDGSETIASLEFAGERFAIVFD